MLFCRRSCFSRCPPTTDRAFTSQVLSAVGWNELQRWEEKAAESIPAVKVRVLYHNADVSCHQEGCPSRAVVLLGSRHDCRAAAEQISGAIDELRPSAVGLELCQKRLKRLLPFGLESFARMPAESQRAIQSQLSYGKEQLAAALAAHRLGIAAVPCDQDVRMTEKRFLAELPPDVLLAGACVASGLPSASMFLAWIYLARQLQRICQGLDDGKIIKFGLLPFELNTRLHSKARALAADDSLSSRERWTRMRAAIEEAAKEVGQTGPSGIVEETLESAIKHVIIHERNIVLCHRISQLEGPLVIGVVGVAHLDGLAGQFTALQASGKLDPSVDDLAKVRLPLWKRVIGHPLLLRLRGSL